MRWIWIDRFEAFVSGQRAVAVKQLSHAEDVFAAHFAEWPVYPAALILEGLAQTGGILVGEANEFREKVVLAKVSKAKFHAEAVPGQELRYDVTMLSLRAEGAVVACKATADGQPLAEAEIQFAHLDQSRSAQLFGDTNFVFGGEMKRIVDSARKAGVAPT